MKVHPWRAKILYYKILGKIRKSSLSVYSVALTLYPMFSLFSWYHFLYLCHTSTPRLSSKYVTLLHAVGRLSHSTVTFVTFPITYKKRVQNILRIQLQILCPLFTPHLDFFFPITSERYVLRTIYFIEYKWIVNLKNETPSPRQFCRGTDLCKFILSSR